MCWLICGKDAADAVAEAECKEETKENKLAREKLLKLISQTKKQLGLAEEEHKVCCKKHSELQRKSDAGIKNAKFLKHCDKNEKDIAFKTKVVNVFKKALDSLVNELNALYGCHDHKDDIMNLEIRDSDDESGSTGGEADEKKVLLKQLFATKQHYKEAVSERKVCNKTWRQLKDKRFKKPTLRFVPEENDKFKSAIEKLSSAYSEEKRLKKAYEDEVAKLSEFYEGQDDVTIEPDDTDMSEVSDVSDNESDIHYSDSEIEGEEE